MTTERDSTMTLEQAIAYLHPHVTSSHNADWKKKRDAWSVLMDHLAARDAVVSDVQVDFSVNFMAGWLEGEREEVLRNWANVKRAALESLASREVAVPDAMEVRDIRDPFFTGSTTDAYANGWNACRQAMLASQDEVK
jgi:hypothetical protein